MIISDQLVIRSYSGPDFFAPDSLVVKPNIALDQGQQLSMATQLAAQTGLTQAFALNCLGELGWDLEKAVAGAFDRDGDENLTLARSRRADPQSDPAGRMGVERIDTPLATTQCPRSARPRRRCSICRTPRISTSLSINALPWLAYALAGGLAGRACDAR